MKREIVIAVIGGLIIWLAIVGLYSLVERI